MATYTPNFSLTMPDYAEPADVAVLNGNTSQIDSLIYQGRRMAVGGYDSTTTYNTGDLVEYSNALYRCKEDGVTGTWDSTKWELTTLADEIESKGEGGADVTKEVSGNPVEFTDGADAPMVKCVSAITGSQDLHGYDKPWVGGAGKNKFGGTVTTSSMSFSDGDATNTNTDSLTEFRPKVTLFKNGSEVASKFGGSISATGRYSINFLASYDFDTVELKHNGSQRDLKISVSLVANSVISVSFYVAGYNPSVVGGLVLQEIQAELSSTESDYSPYSNICPITAYTEGEIEVRGKNLAELKSDLNVSGIGEVVTASGYTAIISKVKKNVTYVISKDGTQTTPECLGYYYTYPELGDISYNSGRVIPSSGVITPPIDGYVLARMATTAQTGYQLELGMSATDYEPYTSTTHTTTYPSAIYRGSEDVVNGSVTVNRVKWTKNTSTMNNSENYPGWANSGISELLGHGINRGFTNVTMNIGDTYNVNTTGALDILFLPKEVYGLNQTEWKALAIDVEIIVELATPTTNPVTPTNLPIKSLNGYNHIESSTGDMEIEYITKDFQPIVDLIEANASEPYSDDYTLDTEIEVGTWVDGSTLYRKTKEITGTKNAGYEGTIYTAGSGEHIVKLDGCIYNDYYSGMAYPINIAYSTNNGTMAFSTLVTGADAEEVFFRNGWSSAVSKIYLVVYYIKSSS